MYEIIIKPKSKWMLLDIKEIIRYRELLFIFTWRDLKVRYKQTILGVLWVVFQPIVSTIIFTIFFGNLAKIPSGDLPYSLFALSGLVLWTFFSSSLTYASDSMIINENIIKKVYFPRIILPLSSIFTTCVDFVINVALLTLFSILIGYYPKPLMIFIFPFCVFITVISSFGLGALLSSINVKYRDVHYVLPFFIQILLFLTPVIYPLTIITNRHKLIMALNPMTLSVELFRSIFTGVIKIDPLLFTISFFSSILILIVGLWYFHRTERFFADIV